MSEIEISEDELDAYNQTGPSAPAPARRGKQPQRKAPAPAPAARTAKKTAHPVQQVLEMESEQEGEEEEDVVLVSGPGKAPRKQPAGRAPSKKAAGRALVQEREDVPLGGPPRKQPASKSKKTAMPLELEEEEEGEGEGGGEEVDEVDEEPAARPAKAAPKRPPAANGRGKASAKGKGRADPAAMEVDEPDVVEVQEDEDVAAQRAARARKAGAAAAARHAREEEARAREHERTQRQLANVSAERDKLTKQLDELFRIRYTEPETALRELTAQYEARDHTQKTLINELTAQIARAKTSSAPEKGFALHFLTREAADEEKAALAQDVEKLRAQVKQRDAQLAEAREQAKVLRSDLEAEIERAKALARSAPPAAARAGAPRAADDRKHAEVIKLYEDMTNFLITNVKIEKSPSLELEELVYMCIYTAGQEGQDTEVRPSLTFQLRKFWQRLEDADTDADAEGGGAPPDRAELVQKIQYTPLNLGFESDAFVQRLDFLRDSFTFAAEQMDVFLKTLKKVMAVDEDEQDEQEAEGGEPMEEHV